MSEQIYDYIICGAGAAGMSMAYFLSDDAFKDKRILMLDQDKKEKNDHTWCYWDNHKSPFDEILTNAFDHIYFHSQYYSDKLKIAPYSYKMLQADKFYKFIHEKLKACSHIEFRQEAIKRVTENQFAEITTDKNTYRARIAFKSFIDYDIDISQHLYVAQHFGGWFIKMEDPYFDTQTATFMDFRIPQNDDCRFFYVLPVSPNEALVEIAIFSNHILKQQDYDTYIEAYISTYLNINKYSIKEKEIGVIPMTDYPFWKHNSRKIYHIGGAGGAIKPSSGFAFKRIQQHTQLLIEALKNGKDLNPTYSIFQNRFHLYDQVLLDVLLTQDRNGDKIFTELFRNNPAPQVYRFLDGDTSIMQEMKLFSSLPIWPFLRGWIRQKIGV